MKNLPQFLTGASIQNLIWLLSHNRVERRYWYRAAKLVVCSALLSPFYLLDSLAAKIVPRPLMHPSPVFVIGHWRSGTTYLHYLLSKDKQFACCTNTDAFTPGSLFIGRWLLKKIIALRLPETRPMDNVKLDANKPQEDEFAMMLLTPYSFYHSFVFPATMKDLFFKYVAFDPENVDLIYRWKKSYYGYLSRLSLRYGNKRLLLKNPLNTARLKYITGLFPKAKFIYLHRSPAEVKLSTQRMLTSMIAANCLHTFDESELVSNVDLFHKNLIKEYETQRHVAEPENLVEINYDELVARPLDTLQKIYDTLQLGDFDSCRNALKDFIAEQSKYKPHNYQTATLNL